MYFNIIYLIHFLNVEKTMCRQQEEMFTLIQCFKTHENFYGVKDLDYHNRAKGNAVLQILKNERAVYFVHTEKITHLFSIQVEERICALFVCCWILIYKFIFNHG